MTKLNSKKILYRIIQKGGMMADCAKLYINDDDLAERFILECSAQCHYKTLRKHWGKDLIADIRTYYRKKKLNE